MTTSSAAAQLQLTDIFMFEEKGIPLHTHFVPKVPGIPEKSFPTVQEARSYALEEQKKLVQVKLEEARRSLQEIPTALRQQVLNLKPTNLTVMSIYEKDFIDMWIELNVCNHHIVAIDTEFDERTRTIRCLQIASGNLDRLFILIVTFPFITLRFWGNDFPTRLKELITDEKRTKYMVDPRFDQRILARHDIKLGGICDLQTEMHTKLYLRKRLSRERMSQILFESSGQRVPITPKIGHKRWNRTPLPDKYLEYSKQDILCMWRIAFLVSWHVLRK